MWSSLPSQERESSSATNRPAIAAEASPSWGSSLLDHHEPARQLAGPLVAVLAVDGDRVLAADRQQPLDHDLAVSAVEAGVGDHRQRLAEQRRQPEVTGEA